jgi:hypothetical protein
MPEQQSLSTGVEVLKLIVASGIGGTVASCIGNWFFKKKLQAQQSEYDKKLASLNSKLQRKNTVHKLQFEKEFCLYQELWKTIVDVQRVARITPALDFMPEGESPLDVYKKRWKKTAGVLQQAIDVLYFNLPFYHHDISGLADELLTKYHNHMTNIQFNLQMEKIDVETYTKNDLMFAEIINTKKDIEMAIRKRVGLLQEAEIID